MRFLTSLLPHQVKAVEKLGRLKVGALYMEQGTGKTRTALELAVRRLNAGKVRHIVWLCPCNVKSEIRSEIARHIPSLTRITICGIETLSSSVRWNSALLRLVTAIECFLIIDESSFIKNGQAIRSRNIVRLSEHCRYKLILNGTPVSKNEADLFNQWYALDWRILGYRSFWGFANKHVVWSKDVPGKIDKIKNVSYLTDRIAPYTYQIAKKDAFDLPEKRYKKQYVDLTRAQRGHYRHVAEYMIDAMDDLEPTTIYRMFSALEAVISGLWVYDLDKKPFVTTPMYDRPEDNPRIQALLSILPEEKAIIFCKRKHEVDSIMQALTHNYGENSCVEFTGAISAKQRQQNKEAFKASAQFMVANKVCGAYGLNLQYCYNVIYYSNDWDYATRAQSEDRVHRKGQESVVVITDIIAENTLDERILDCLLRKENLLDSVRHSIKSKQELLRMVTDEKQNK